MSLQKGTMLTKGSSKAVPVLCSVAAHELGLGSATPQQLPTTGSWVLIQMEVKNFYQVIPPSIISRQQLIRGQFCQTQTMEKAITKFIPSLSISRVSKISHKFHGAKKSFRFESDF